MHNSVQEQAVSVPQQMPISWIGWTDELTGILRDLVENKHPSRSIAAILGTTRGSVIGKCHRIGLKLFLGQGRAKPGERRPTPKQLRGRANIRQDFPPVEPLNIPFSDLEAKHCRYPTTDGSPYLFCGHHKKEGSSYCGYHHNFCTSGR